MSTPITQAVAGALENSHEFMTIPRLCDLLGASNADVRVALRELAQAGQIEVSAAGTGRPTRYGWLHSANPVVPTAEAPGPSERQLTPEAEVERADFISDYGTGEALPPAADVEREAEPVDPNPIIDADLPFTNAHPPVGYLLVVTKRKPRVIRSLERAQQAALSAVRNGAKRAQVFELQPYGIASRGAEWEYAYI